jgi:hypothetical protein
MILCVLEGLYSKLNDVTRRELAKYTHFMLMFHGWDLE